MNRYDILSWMPIILIMLIYLGYIIYDNNLEIILIFLVIGILILLSFFWMKYFTDKSWELNKKTMNNEDELNKKTTNNENEK